MNSWSPAFLTGKQNPRRFEQFIFLSTSWLRLLVLKAVNQIKALSTCFTRSNVQQPVAESYWCCFRNKGGGFLTVLQTGPTMEYSSCQTIGHVIRGIASGSQILLSLDLFRPTVFNLLLARNRFAPVSNGDQRTSSFGQTMDLFLLKRIDHLLETRLHPPHFRTNRVIVGAQKVFPRFVSQRTPRFFKQKDRPSTPHRRTSNFGEASFVPLLLLWRNRRRCRACIGNGIKRTRSGPG